LSISSCASDRTGLSPKVILTTVEARHSAASYRIECDAGWRVKTSHLLAGDGVEVWLAPLVFLMFGIASWALRPADRRLPNAGLEPELKLRAWAVPIGLLILVYVVSFLTLPWVNVTFHQRQLISAGFRAESNDHWRARSRNCDWATRRHVEGAPV
jgi:hypothetical protein